MSTDQEIANEARELIKRSNERLVAAEIIANGIEGLRDCKEAREFYAHLALMVEHQNPNQEAKAIIFDYVKDTLMAVMTDHYMVEQ